MVVYGGAGTGVAPGDPIDEEKKGAPLLGRDSSAQYN